MGKISDFFMETCMPVPKEQKKYFELLFGPLLFVLNASNKKKRGKHNASLCHGLLMQYLKCEIREMWPHFWKKFWSPNAETKQFLKTKQQLKVHYIGTRKKAEQRAQSVLLSVIEKIEDEDDIICCLNTSAVLSQLGVNLRFLPQQVLLNTATDKLDDAS